MNIKATDECSPTLHSLAVHHPSAGSPVRPYSSEKSRYIRSKLVWQGREGRMELPCIGGGGRHRLQRRHLEILPGCVGMYQESPMGTWIWDLQRTSWATSRASTTGLAIVQIRNMWAICWVGWVMQQQQAMRLKNLMLSLLLSAGSLEPLCLGKVFKEKNNQQWISIYWGTASMTIWSTQVHGMRQDAPERAERIGWCPCKAAFNFLY